MSTRLPSHISLKFNTSSVGSGLIIIAEDKNLLERYFSCVITRQSCDFRKFHLIILSQKRIIYINYIYVFFTLVCVVTKHEALLHTTTNSRHRIVERCLRIVSNCIDDTLLQNMQYAACMIPVKCKTRAHCSLYCFPSYMLSSIATFARR